MSDTRLLINQYKFAVENLKVSCRVSCNRQVSEQQLLARWVQSLNPACILTDDNICTTLRNGEALLTILALVDSAHILIHGQAKKSRSRIDALRNLDVVLQYIYNGKAPLFVHSESLYTTVDPKNWWHILSDAFHRRAYLPLKRRESNLVSLFHPADKISFPLNNGSPSPVDPQVYTFLLYNYFLVPCDFLSLITLRPKNISQIKLNWSIITLVLNLHGIKLIFTPDELTQLQMTNDRSSNSKICAYMSEYMLLSLLDTLQARAKTAPPGEGELLGPLIRKLRHEHPDRKFYYCFSDYFVIIHFNTSARSSLEYVPKSHKHVVLNMLSLNRCTKCVTIPCTADHRFFLFFAKMVRNPSGSDFGTDTAKWTDCSLILSPVCLLVVTLLDDIFIPLAWITQIRTKSFHQHLLLLFKEAISGLSSLLLCLESGDFSALVHQLTAIIT
ncbi:hypothetical protein GL50803_0010758 [Giardia duodenalis]|uniref:Uncharacterized protein n=1 Tax=Giardia intestinalis (strain ATCC 50803 / WB clone C6) TaxID=184922 RepID=D3KHF2_GIAIC|nr:hypothetical protein GL50803_0010758 [Giardia intestinalis]KAE8303901.1 hypothetical protein GL50803_0010758 [Giardia intestinalis]